MEIELFVSVKELEEFPEEAADSSETQEQSNSTSPSQGTVKSLLSVDTSPTPKLLDRIRKGKVAHIVGYAPSLKGGSIKGALRPRRSKPYIRYCKQPWLLVIRVRPQVSKQPSHLL